MSNLLSLSDEQAKRETSDCVTSLIRYLKDLYYFRADSLMLLRKQEIFHSFWLDYTLKGIKSGSLVLRLFSWEQIYEIIKETMNGRPYAESYFIRGAGNEDANGTYIFHHFDTEGSPVYIKQPTRDNMALLTLFRCTMRNKAKWWFLSQVDLERPGTEADIDYYQFKSSYPLEEKEPPCRGWTCASIGTTNNANNNNNSPILPVSREPAPILQRVGILKPMMTTTNTV